MLHVELIDNAGSLRRMEEEWNEMLSHSDMDIPFLRTEWLDCWWKVYGSGNEMLAAVVREDGNARLIAPLMRTSMKLWGLPVRTITFMDNFHAGRMAFIQPRHDPEAVDALFSFLRGASVKYDLLLLSSVVKGSSTEESVRHLIRRHSPPFFELPGGVSPYLAAGRSWEEYLKSRSGHTRSAFRQLQKKYGPDFEIVRYSDRDALRGAEELLSVSRRTWKFRAGSAIASDPLKAAFLRDLAAMASAKGWLDLWILKRLGEPIAFYLNLRYKERVYCLKVGHDERFNKLWPGDYLCLNSLRDCFDSRYIEYDFLGKDSTYKQKWTQTGRDHVKFYIFNDTFYGRMLYYVGARLKPAVKQSIDLLAGVFRRGGAAAPMPPRQNPPSEQPVPLDAAKKELIQ